MVDFFTRDGKPDIAYHLTPPPSASAPFIMFCGGYRSDMMGTKAQFLEERCKAHGWGYLRFDYTGHGQSGGDFEAGFIGDWLEDARAVFAALVPAGNPVLIVGSSMGGWVGLTLARDNAAQVRGFVGIAAAPDFTSWIEADLTPDQRHALDTQGYFEEPNEYSDEPYRFRKDFLEEARTHFMMADGRLPYAGPVRLLQGMQDSAVEWQFAHRLKNALDSKDCDVLLIEDGDHSLSRPHDLALLEKSLVDLAGRI